MSVEREDKLKAWAGLVTLAVSPLLTLLKAAVARDLWVWFVEPAFGVPVPGYWIVVGLLFVPSLLGRFVSASEEEAAKRLSSAALIGKLAAYPVGYGLVWCMAWAVHSLSGAS